MKSFSRLLRRKRLEDESVEEILHDLRKIKESEDNYVGGAANDGHSTRDWSKILPPGYGAP